MKFIAEITMDNPSFDNAPIHTLGTILMAQIADRLAAEPIKRQLLDRQFPLRDPTGQYVGFWQIAQQQA